MEDFQGTEPAPCDPVMVTDDPGLFAETHRRHGTKSEGERE